MADYKVVDIEQLEADLTEVADSIRAKAGTSNALAFPDGFKSAIASIETDNGGDSGGLPDGFSAINSGLITYDSATYAPTIEHGLGVKPNFFYVVAVGSITIGNNSGYMVAHLAVKQSFDDEAGWYTTISISSAGINTMSGNVISTANIDNYFGAETFMPYGFFKAGVTYRWVAGVIDI